MSDPNRYSFVNPAKSPVFYGYIILLVGTLGIWASVPGQTIGVSVFTDPVKDALGLSRNQFSNAYMIGTLMSAMVIGRAGITVRETCSSRGSIRWNRSRPRRRISST